MLPFQVLPQGTFTPLDHAHVGRTHGNQPDRPTAAPHLLLASRLLPALALPKNDAISDLFSVHMYLRSRYRRPNPTAPELSSLDELSISDLVKIYNAIGRYHAALRTYWEKKAAYDCRKQERQAALWKREAVYDSQIRVLEHKRASLLSDIASHQFGVLSRTLFGSPSIDYRGIRYSHERASTIEAIIRLDQEISQLHTQRSSLPPDTRRLPELEPGHPASGISLTIGGVKFLVSLDRFRLEHVERLIAKKKAEEESKTRAVTIVIDGLKARASTNEQQRRRQARSHSRKFSAQVAVVPHCPYCRGPLEFSDAHVDHIYPVAKGGHSSEGNLVFVCAACNIKKRKMTLRFFAKKHGLDFKVISDDLERLGKDF